MKHLSFLFLLISFSLAGQSSLSTNSKKAAEYYREADNYWVRRQYDQAIELLEEAVKKDDEFYEAYFRLGTIFKARNDIERAEEYLRKTLLYDPSNAGANFELGELYIRLGQYAQAKIHIDNYLARNPKNRNRLKEANQFLENIAFAMENENTISNFNPQPLPENVNQYALQYFPVLTADQEQLIYTRRLGDTFNDDEDLVISTKLENGNWSDPQSLSDNINSQFNEGTCTISADGKILIFTSCNGRPGYGSCDLYISYKTGDEWSFPKNMGGTINSQAWDSQPALSADGRTLFFISNRPGGVGRRDIWMTRLDSTNNWTKPVNMGQRVNTTGDEVSPFLHPNGLTLYYASNGLEGFGGFDIYYVNRLNEFWSEPRNFGAPINTGEDQVSLFITADGKKGYYSHENLESDNNKGALYEFDVPEALQLEVKTSFVKGKVTDAVTGEPLAAEIELINTSENARTSLFISDSISGNYLTVVNENTAYAFYVNKQGYLFKSLRFELDESVAEKIIDIALEPVQVGSNTTLNNVLFEFDSYELRKESLTELNKILNFLNENPTVEILIEGHTDNVGDDTYNQILSQQRAEAVRNWLISNGLQSARIQAKGFGSTEPVASNESEKGRRLNRRINIKIR